MSGNVLIAIIAAAGSVLAAVAGGLMSKLGKSRFERDVDIYLRMESSINGFDDKAMKAFRKSIESKITKRKHKLKALGAVSLIMLFSFALPGAVLRLTGMLNEEERVWYLIFFGISAVLALVFLFAWELSTMYQYFLERFDDSDKEERVSSRESQSDGEECECA